MKLMMAVCGHKFCESCVTIHFLKSMSMNCPDCSTVLKKNSFILQSFDDSVLQKESAIRKKILNIYNKRKEDFQNLTEYNDYLEMVEDIIFNLITNTDVEATNERVKKYQAENQQNIFYNQSKKASEDRLIKLQILEEDKKIQERKKKHILEDQEEAKKRLQDRLDMIHAQADKKGQKGKPAAKKKEEKKETPAAPEVPAQNPMQYRPSAPGVAAQTTAVPAQPALPAQPLSSAKPIPSAHVDMRARERAGGYREEYIKRRALEEAFDALLIVAPFPHNTDHAPSMNPPSLSPMKIS
eukprot:Phypoly_transcript_13469.p1 GENE.Phypoly_transcript_13469~~Phypoly_transcript_13469.p1  ORF type:complete len:333 (+),score=89.59 Phypoly_transcript_13469:109-999(+)